MRIFENKDVKKIKIAVLFILLYIIISPNIVNATIKTSSTACKNKLFAADDGNNVGISAGDDSYSILINVKEGTWDLYYYIDNDEDNAVEEADWSDVVSASGGLKKNEGSSTKPKRHHIVYHAGDPVPDKLTNIKRGKNNKVVYLFMILKSHPENDNRGMDKNEDLLKAGGSTCVAGSDSNIVLNKKTNSIKVTKVNGKNPTVVIAMNTIPTKLDKTTVNQSGNAECAAMRNGKYNADGSDSTYNITDSSHLAQYTNIMENSFPYCFKGTTASFQLDNATIRSTRKKSLKAFKEYVSFKEAQKDNKEFDAATKEIQADGYKEIKLKNNKATVANTLACSKAATKEKTQKFYAKSVVENNEVCKVTCQEQFQVTYDPPVAVKAGLCFQYKVTVRSKVTCKTEETGGIKWPTPPSTCGYVPICSNNAAETQAGPNEDFDNCVNACDGGKYSQSCINSCYKKIYEDDSKSNTMKTSSTTINPSTIKDYSVEKLAKSSKDPYYQNKNCDSNAKISSNMRECANYFYQIKQKYPMGYYVDNTGDNQSWIGYRWRICWTSDTKKCTYTDDDDNELSLTVDRWNEATSYGGPPNSVIEHLKRSSPYYLRTPDATYSLIASFWAIGTGLNGHGGRRYYQIDNRGIKRQWNGTYKCHEVCGYVASGGNQGSCLTSSKEVKDYYTEQLEKIETNLAKCKAQAVCKEDKATFYIDVTDKKTYSDKKKESWTATNQSSSKSSTPQTGGDTSMFIPLECTDAQKNATPLVCDVEKVEAAPGINGQCYGRDNPKYWQHYKTTITFPGTWINLKSAERVYKKPNSSSLNNYREKENYYCTGYDSEDVNVDWWNWKVNGKGNINSITIQKDNNITANISDFGKFNWSVGLKCFFGLYTKVCDPSSDDPLCNFNEDEDPCSGENSTAICNYKFRVIDQQNMFPDEQGLKGNRERGFNWTTKAIDNTIPADSSYFINPEQYWQQLEASAATAFPRTDAEFSNADYRVKLSIENIRNIKSYVKKNNFNAFTGTYHKVTPEVEGLYYYRSGLRNNTSLVSSWTGDLAGKNNN